VLLVGAVLCVRSLLNAQSINPGFDVNRVAVATLDPGSVGYDEPQRRAFYDALLERVEHLPGVTAASWVNHLPLSAAREQGSAVTQTNTGKHTISVDVLRVAPRYFATMGTPFSRGRDFTQHARKPGPVIINDTMARQLWPGQDPLGRRVVISGWGDAPVIGVVKTGKYRI
jgi:macrolide transport system ATP-binding/permease protein